MRTQINSSVADVKLLSPSYLKLMELFCPLENCFIKQPWREKKRRNLSLKQGQLSTTTREQSPERNTETTKKIYGEIQDYLMIGQGGFPFPVFKINK